MNRAASKPWTVRGVNYAALPMLAPDRVTARLGNDGGSGVEQEGAQAGPESSKARIHLQTRPSDRGPLADRLITFNHEVGNPLSPSTLEAIRGEGVFVIAGQQPGLLLGPMYTLLKAMSAVELAERMRDRADVPVVPAFWIAGEDHDIEEVNRCLINGRKLVIPHGELERGGARPPVGRLSLEPWREEIIAFIGDALKGMPHRDWAVDLVESVRFESYSVMFAELLARLLGRHGVVLIDPMRLREWTGPALARMVEQWDALQEAFREGTERVRSMGFDPPLDRMNLFRIDNAGRTSIDDPRTLAPDEVRRNPEQFSPGAALRPIVQDMILPTAATVAGPTELLYLWQIDPLYEVLGVQRSTPRPRLSATFLDDAVTRRAERFDLGGERIFRVLDRLDEYQPAERIEDSEDLRELETLGEQLLQRIDRLMDDQTRKPLEKARRSIEHQIGKVADRVRQRRLEAAGVGRKRIERIAEAVYPTGKMQERVVSPLDLLARFGPTLIDGMMHRLDPTADKHWLVEVGGEGSGRRE